MAALSSTQSGNFNSASTWGGTSPSDGDTFTINRGHEVIVNSDLRQTNGYGDIQVYGHLKFETNAKFRLNGRITVRGNNSGTNYNTPKQFTKGDNTTGGLFSSSGNNMLLEVRGSNADQHGIWVETERYASMKLSADEKRTTTSSTAAVSPNNSYITVSNTSGFAAGDWLAIYREGNQDNRVLGDEGFWVHDVDTANKRIYVRQFVAPSSTIEDISGNNVKVTNAKVFRKGYYVICGTGSSRTVAKINDINYARNTITTSVTLNGNNEGGTLYQTGAEKFHASGDAVQKIATTITTAITSANSTNQITVGSANDISVGDEIIIDVNNDSDTNWDYDTKYTVTAKSGTTLTLNANVRYKHKVGSVVQILTRHFVIKGIDNNSGTRPFLYVEYWTDYNNAHTRHIGLKNIQFTQWGYNTKSTYYRGVMIAGYNSEYRDNESTNGRYQFQSHLQGCTIHDPNTLGQHYTSFTIRHPHGFISRNNVSYNCGHDSMRLWSSQYNHKVYNNYMSRSSYTTFVVDSLYEPYTELAYNYLTRSDDYGILLHHYRESMSIRHNIFLHHEQRPFYAFYCTGDTTFERLHIDGFRSLPYIGEGNGTVNFLDCYMDNKWFKSIDTGKQGIVDSNRYLGYGSASSRTRYDRTTSKVQHAIYYEHNHQYDAVLNSNQGAGTYTHSGTGKYKEVYTFQGSTYSPFVQNVYVPAGATVRISCKMNLSTNSHTRPYLFATKQNGYKFSMGRYRTDYTNQTSTQSSSSSSTSEFYGFLQSTQFSASAQGRWEEKQLTVSPQDKGYFLLVGIWTYDNNRDEVHLLELPNIFIDESSPIKKGDTMGKQSAVRSTFSRTKKRIGGTRL